MNLDLRPSTLGEILDRTASLYRARFWVFFGIASFPAGVVLAFAAAFFLLITLAGTRDPANVALSGLGMLTVVLVGTPICLVVTALAYAAISHAASLALLGDRPTILASYKAAWKRGGRYIGLLALQMLILAVAPLVVWTLIVLLLAFLAVLARQSGVSTAGPSALMLLLFFALATYSIWMLLRLCLAFPVSVVEGIGAWAALKRASALSNGTRGRILLLYVLGVALGWVVSLLITVPITIAVAMFPGMNSPQHQQTLGVVIMVTFYAASFAVQALTKPVYGIALVLFYYDQRIRKEAFDIEYLMRQAGMIAPPAPAPAAAPWLPPIPPHPEPQAAPQPPHPPIAPPLAPSLDPPPTAPETAGGQA